jgi:uncharacterized delta-60 repeat protein
MWFRSTTRTKRASSARQRYFRPQVQTLEDRCLLSAGALDTTFGSGGIVTTALTKGNDYANGCLLQPNGDIIVYGNDGLARYTPSGSLDTTFGSGGLVLRPPSFIAGAALQADGKIVAAGGSSLFRFNANGSLDKTFGSNGVVTYPSGWGAGPDLLIEPATGDIVLEAQPSSGPSVFGLLRYTPNGVLDTTFGQGGKVATPFPDTYAATSSWQGLTLENGHIVEAGFVATGGSANTPNSHLWALVRYNDNGSLDTSFGPSGTGLVTTAVGYGSYQTTVRSLVVQTNGEIVAVGVAQNPTNSGQEWALARYDTAGNLDSTFGSGGIVTSSFTAGGDEIWSAALQANGQIVVAGFNDGSPQFMEIGRYNSDGSLDTTFGSGGLVSTPFASQSAATGVVIQTDGKIVAAGYTTINGKVDFMLARLLGDSPSFAITGFPSSITAGTAGTFTVTARNADGSTNTNYTGTLHFTSTDPNTVLPADYTFTAADMGVHSFSATLVTAGSQSITATDTATSSTFGSETGIAVTPAPASSFVVSGYPTSITQGTAGTFTITAVDPYGNVATGYTGTVQFSSSDPLASLPANYTFTAADAGVHTFSATLNTVGTESLTATDTLNSSITGIETGITVNKKRGH